MKVYVYEDVDDLDDCDGRYYHNNGGVFIACAGNPLNVLLEAHPNATQEVEVDCKPYKNKFGHRMSSRPEMIQPKPAFSYDIPDGSTERLVTFYDSGCC